MSIQVDSEVWAWLHEYGLVATRAGGAGGKAAGKGVRAHLPAHVSAGLLSGEMFGKLLNGIFAKHGLKQSVKLEQGDDHYGTWESVSQGLHRLSVELDEDTIKALASGDVGLVTELIGELHQVYRHWVATEVKKRRRRQVDRRAQPQQGGGYSRVLPSGNKDAVGTESPSERPSVVESSQRELPASVSAVVEPTPRETETEVESVRGQDMERSPNNATERRQADRNPKDALEDWNEAADVEQRFGGGMMRKASNQLEVPAFANIGAVPAVDAKYENPRVAPAIAQSVPHNAAPLQQPLIAPRAPVHEKSGVNLEMVLRNLSVDCEIEKAASAPELVALSMLHNLRISPSQARSLLVEDGRRLARALADSNERHATYLTRWLRSLSFYCGALVELLLLHPEHAVFVLNTLGLGMRAASPAVAEVACRILAILCGGLQRARLGAFAFNWLLESPALKDLGSLLSTCPAAQSSVAAMVFNCSGEQLLPVLAQNLKQASRGEQDYLGTVHLLLSSFLEQAEMNQVCVAQGVFSHFLARCVQRVGDDRSTPGTQQAAALLASELWLVSVEHKGTQQASAPEGPGELLAALKRASQNDRSHTLCLVAFSCLSRLLDTLCSRCDPENTPAVYRTFVYALVETEDSGVRDFATRNLMGLMQQHIGMPVGILVEPMMKKLQVAQNSLISILDIELFLTIAKHPRCTARHAEMLAQVLGRASVENAEFGRSATIPFLVIFHRFAEDAVILAFFEKFMQITLSRLIQKGVPKVQTTQTLEVLAKVACLRIPILESTMQRMLVDICKAYLMNYEALHPNLRALLELWPSEEAAVDEWGRAQFMPEKPQSQHGRDAVENDATSMILRSVSPSLRSEGLTTPALSTHPDRYDSSQQEQHPPRSVSRIDHEDYKQDSGDLSNDDASQFCSPRDSVTDRTDAHVQQLAEETEQLREELEKAKERHQESLQEAEKLRQQLDEAKHVHEKVEEEVSNLQNQRENLLRQQGSRRGAHGRQQDRTQTDSSERDADKISELVEAFVEPLQAVLQMPLQSKKNRGARDLSTLAAADALELLLAELDLPPGKLTKKTIGEAIKAAAPQSRDSSLTFDLFLSVLPKIANKVFAPQDATPFRDFGIVVPTKKDPVVMRQTQALIQHMAKIVHSGKLSALPSARVAFKGAVRRWVLKYARSVLEDLNSRLKRGEDVPERDIPDGFEILFRVPPALYTVPEGMPVSIGEKFSVEILDDILFQAIGVHFLEPAAAAKGPVPIVVVRGHEDLAALDIEPQSSLDNHTVRNRDERELQGGRRTNRASPRTAAPSSADARTSHRDSVQRRQDQAEKEEQRQEASQKQHPRDHSRERGIGENEQASPRPPRPRVPAQRAQPHRTEAIATPQRPDVSSNRQWASRRQSSSPSPVQISTSNSRSAPQSSVGNPVRNAVPPVTSVANPSAQAPGRRERQLQRLSSVVNLGKERQEAIHAVFQSHEVQPLVKAASSGMRRTFEFFANWKGGNDGSMLLAGFFFLGECFGILDKNALKVIHRQVGGQGLRAEQFPEALFLCAVRYVETKTASSQLPLSEEKLLWVSTLRALCTHMLLFDTQSLRRQLDAFRRKGEVPAIFQPQLSTLQEEITPRVAVLAPTAVEQSLTNERTMADVTVPRGVVELTEHERDEPNDAVVEPEVIINSASVATEEPTSESPAVETTEQTVVDEPTGVNPAVESIEPTSAEDVTATALLDPNAAEEQTTETKQPSVVEEPTSVNPAVESTEPTTTEEVTTSAAVEPNVVGESTAETSAVETTEQTDVQEPTGVNPAVESTEPPTTTEVRDSVEAPAPTDPEHLVLEPSSEPIEQLSDGIQKQDEPEATSKEQPVENQESPPDVVADTGEQQSAENLESVEDVAVEASKEQPAENQESTPDVVIDGSNPVDT